MTLERLHLDKSLFYALIVLAGVSLIVVYSASGASIGVVARHAVRLALGFAFMLAVAQIRPENLQRLSPWIFVFGLIMLVAVFAFGEISKGAQRWLDLGVVRFQPSELMKLGLPMALAWYFSRQPLPPHAGHIVVGFVALAVPTLLIAEQPDLGTAVLVLASGLVVLFLAGLSWRLIIAGLASFTAAIPLLWAYLHDYQRQRVLTLLNPEADPTGTGYHTLQSMIAIGSGGLFGKGWLNGTQAHLEFLPESSTDFIFAVLAEEFGLVGIVFILGLYLFIVGRGLTIAFHSRDTYARLLAGGFSLIFFVYVFVNVGMVSGILPVVGVPLPLISYGGTSAVTLLTAFGMLMAVQTHRRLAA